MATRTKHADPTKPAARPSPPGEATAILSTLTTTLLAGAVTGAVVQAREAAAAQPAREAAPARTPESQESIPAERSVGERMAPAPIDRFADGGEVAPAGDVRPQDTGSEDPQAEAAALADTGAARASDDDAASDGPVAVATGVDGMSMTGVAPDAKPSAEPAPAVTSSDALSSVEMTAPPPRDATATSSAAVSAFDERIEASVARLREDAVRSSDAVGSSAGEPLELLSGAMHSGIASLQAEAASLGEALSDRIDSAFVAAEVAIPASILGGSETDDERPGDFLTRLIETLDAAPAVEAPFVAVLSPAAAPGSDVGSTPDEGDPFQDVFDLGEAVGAIRIGFTGLSYTETDAQDGPSPHNVNLLQGLF